MTFLDLVEQGLDIKNVKITNTKLGFYNGYLSYFLTVVGDGFSAQIGGAPIADLSICATTITGILSICDVASWEDVSGSFIRVAIDKNTNSIGYIGHIIADDEWLCVRTED